MARALIEKLKRLGRELGCVAMWMASLRRATSRSRSALRHGLVEVADRMRGSVDSAKHKHLVLGLLFLKYTSDSFKRRRDWLDQATRHPQIVHLGEDDRVGADQHHGTVLVITSFTPHGHPILAARRGVGPWPSR